MKSRFQRPYITRCEDVLLAFAYAAREFDWKILFPPQCNGSSDKSSYMNFHSPGIYLIVMGLNSLCGIIRRECSCEKLKAHFCNRRLFRIFVIRHFAVAVLFFALPLFFFESFRLPPFSPAVLKPNLWKIEKHSLKSNVRRKKDFVCSQLLVLVLNRSFHSGFTVLKYTRMYRGNGGLMTAVKEWRQNGFREVIRGKQRAAYYSSLWTLASFVLGFFYTSCRARINMHFESCIILNSVFFRVGAICSK